MDSLTEFQTVDVYAKLQRRAMILVNNDGYWVQLEDSGTGMLLDMTKHNLLFCQEACENWVEGIYLTA